MKLLAIMRPPEGADVTSLVAARARDELGVLWQLYRDGFVREMYSPGAPGAVLVLEAESAASAAAELARLPLLEGNVMRLELIELHPFSALEMLFSRPEGTSSS